MRYQELDPEKMRKDLGVTQVQKRFHTMVLDRTGTFGFTVINGKNCVTLDGEFGAGYKVNWIILAVNRPWTFPRTILFPKYDEMIKHIKELLTKLRKA